MTPGSPTPHGALTDPVATEEVGVNVAGRIRVRAKVEFSKFAGGFLYLTDQSISGVTSEIRITDWGEAVLLLDGGEDSISLTVSNVAMQSVMPGYGSSTRFSDYWSFNFPPEGAKVTIEISVTETPVWEPLFVGAVTEVSSITDRTVTLEIGDISTKFYREIGDPITRAEYPQAADSAIDRIKPIALGFVKGFTPPKVRERQRATSRTQILASDAMPKDITVDSNKKWPTTGQLKIEEEHFTYDQSVVIGETTIRLTARAQNGTSAAAHASGQMMTERAQESWLVAGHNSTSVAALYGVSSTGELVALDSSLFTIQTTGGKTLVTTLSMDGISVSEPSASPTYRRIDMDTVPGLFGFAALPAGLLSNGTLAKNPEFAAGAMNQWRPENYAVLNFGSRDSLPVRRTATFDMPAAAPEKVWLGVEYYGVNLFGYATKLVYTIASGDATLVVANIANLGPLGDMGTTVPAPGIVFIRVEKEIMQVTGWTGLPGEPGQTTVNVIRGQLGTSAVGHTQDAEIRLHAVSATGQAVEEAIYFPQAYMLFRTGVNTLTNVGKLTDVSDVPNEIVEKDRGYIESQSLEAFHTHALGANDLPKHGKVFSQSSFFNGFDWFQDSYASDLVVATVPDATSGTFTSTTWALNSIQQVQTEVGLTLGAPGVGFVFNCAMAFQASTQQRVTFMRFRIAHSGTAGIKVSLYLPDPNTSGDYLFKQKTFTGGGAFPASAYGMDVDFFKCRFDESTGYPDGLKVARLLSKHCLLHIEPTGSSPVIWSVTAELVLDDQQLVRGADAVEFLGDRTMIQNFPSVAYCDAGPYTNSNQYPGPLTNVPAGNTNGYSSTKLISPWMHGVLQPCTSQNTGAATQQIRNSIGTKPAMVILNSDAGSSNEQDVVRAHLLFAHLTGPGDARVYRVTLTGLGTGRNTCGTPIVKLVNKKDGAPFTFDPDAQSAGPYTSHLSSNYERRCWRWQWDLEQENISLSKLCNSYFISIQAGGSDIAGSCALESPTILIETDKARAWGATGTDAQEYTRVQYFDISQYVPTYATVLGNQVEMRLAKQGFDFLPGEATFGASDRIRPILVSRIFYVFKYTGTESRPLDDIAVDFTGYSLLPGVHGANVIAAVLTNGAPLLSATLADLDLTSFVTAINAGMLPLSGVITEKVDARDLINSLCEQAQVSGYWENGLFALAFKYTPALLPAPTAAFDYTSGDILEDTIQVVRRPKDTVANVVTVNSLPNYAKGGFRETASFKAPSSLVKYAQRQYEVNGDFMETAAATTLAKQILAYRKEPEVVVRFQSTVIAKVRQLRRGNVIQITNAPVAEANTTRLEVVGITKAIGSLSTGIPTWEIEAVYRPNVSDEAPYP